MPASLMPSTTRAHRWVGVFVALLLACVVPLCATEAAEHDGTGMSYTEHSVTAFSTSTLAHAALVEVVDGGAQYVDVALTPDVGGQSPDRLAARTTPIVAGSARGIPDHLLLTPPRAPPVG